MARPLGGNHQHVHVRGRDDLLEVDVKAVGKHQRIAGLQVGGDILLVDFRLNLVVDQHHHHVAPFGRLGHGLDLQSGLLSSGPVLAAGPQTYAHVAAGLLQVQCVGVTLGAIADNSDLLTVQFP